MKLLDVVSLNEDIPSEHLLEGDRGTIVHCHGTPPIAFEVEFCDEDGRTLVLSTLRPEQIDLIWAAP